VPPWPLFTLVHSLASWLPRLQASLLPPHLNAVMLATAFAPSKALYAATQLGVADALAGGPLPAAELAAQKGVKGDDLRRILRALTAHGIFSEVGKWCCLPGRQRCALVAWLEPQCSLGVGDCRACSP